MNKIELHDLDNSAEPAPRFATDAEIALAEQLRCQLEARYFGTSAAHAPVRVRSGQVH